MSLHFAINISAISVTRKGAQKSYPTREELAEIFRDRLNTEFQGDLRAAILENI
jgi:hypothetical protein